MAYGAGHPDWFGEDGLHLTPPGAAALARLASRALPLALAPRGTNGPAARRTLSSENSVPPQRADDHLAAIDAPAVDRCTPSSWRATTLRPR